MNAARDPTSRLRAGLNPLLTTSLGVYHPQPGTPLSATSMTSHNALSAGPTPLSAIQPYNPQEWIGSPVSGPGERGHPFAQEAQSTMQTHQSSSRPMLSPLPVSPLPPPPYSPPRSQRPVSMAYESSPANISAARAPLLQQLPRASPDTTVNASFAPPPGAGQTRRTSRERRFGLPFGRRRETDHTTTPPDSHNPTSHGSPVVQPPTSITSSRPPVASLTLQIPQQRSVQPPTDPDSASGLAPGARRAASTGAIETPVSARSYRASQAAWEPGMPIPPPPPGPPPPGSRSQSLSRTNSGGDPVISPPTRRPPPTGVAALGPVPPTPANWHENNESSQARQSSPTQTSPVETTSAPRNSADDPSSSTSPNLNSGLARQGAVRGEKTLRERRNDSRTRGIRASIDGSLDVSRLSNIVIPSAQGSPRRTTVNRTTPQSARPNLEASTSSGGIQDSRGSTPRALGSAQGPGSHPGSPTPPFSPHPMRASLSKEGPAQPVPKALPTPPPQSSSSATASQMRLVMEPTAPVARSTRDTAVKQSADQFCSGTIERVQAFAQKEAAVSNDAERVRLFAEFIVSESRIRRERYSSAIGAMGSEIFDLTRDLFRPMAVRRESAASQASAVEFTPGSSEPSRSHRGSMASVFHDTPQASGSNSAPTSAKLPMSPTGPPPAGWQQANFMPSLSPILSMSVSDNLDGSSRGRPASRWWESESHGEQAGRIERSKRESKYMGVPKEGLEALQWIDTPSSVPGSSQRDSSNEYPPEKQGWHNKSPAGVGTPQPPFRNSLLSCISSPNTPDPRHLDVSRLVTLPPPYPRHHPAVNNSHPELTAIRNSIRSISDLTEVDGTKQRFSQESKAHREEASEAAKKRRQSLRTNLQHEINSGNMTYAEAAAIEADLLDSEKAQIKELEKKDFDRFQVAVVMPLNDLLQSRIGKASALFDELCSRLFVETQEPNPNMPQEEGDELPELLEKLTLLKWIFEAREMLHRAIYDLLSDRNDRYRDMVLTPYRLSGNEEKLANAQAFFAEDAGKRAQAFAEESLHRTQDFRDVVEENVMRGVEVQLSAFWDIAPPLKRVLDKIPLDLQGFNIQIPPAEFDENPSYLAHPLQHLFSLLLHAEKSTYQFIESQTNLLCLLHEVKEAVATAKAKAMENEGRDARRVEDTRVEEQKRLTDDLKEKVRVVQDQWHSALGETIKGVKERTGEWLLETGGWDESLEEGGVGSV